MKSDRANCKVALDRVKEVLLSHQEKSGLWRGYLSSSALATAVAMSALSIIDNEEHVSVINKGLGWLRYSQNNDGGWGDSPESPSNLSTTLLVRAAFEIAAKKSVPEDSETISRMEAYISNLAGTTPKERAQKLLESYAPDKTFAVPILANLALAELVPWKEIPSLPFEFSLLPRFLYRFVKLEVVSYALPALIAVGQLLAIKKGERLRSLFVNPALNVLEKTQPENGGFLEATPLTAFVCMSLAATGHRDNLVVKKGRQFLLRSQREDGSWPIDTDLALWLSTSAINALSSRGEYKGPHKEALLDQFMKNQQREIHPFTGARPGGWAWTDLPGGVPDCDDTAGALLALSNLDEDRNLSTVKSATKGIHWLLSLQNDDGGWPTFCRGWGHLPFDKSTADITAHILRALTAWKEVSAQIPRAIERGFDFLASTQGANGKWVPLWFGNQFNKDFGNPVFGTSRVLCAYGALERQEDEAAKRGMRFLIESQKDDGSWGGRRDSSQFHRRDGCSPRSIEPISR